MKMSIIRLCLILASLVVASGQNLTKIYFDTETKWLSAMAVNAGGWASFEKYPRTLADVNGDGKVDVIGFFEDGVYVALSTGQSFSTPTKWLQDFCQQYGGYGSYNTYPRTAADVNGDGKADLIAFGQAGTHVALSTGTSFSAAKTWSSGFCPQNGGWVSHDKFPRECADANGDGKADVVGFGDSYTFVSFSSGTGFNDGSTWCNTYSYNAGWTSFGLYPRKMADINGDGKADVVGFASDGVYVSFSTGSSFPTATKMISDYSPSAGGWGSFDGVPRTAADINGDGKADIIGFASDGFYYSLSLGNGFSPRESWVNHFGYNSAAGGWTNYNTYPRLMGDVNGDGRADIVGFAGDGVYVALSRVICIPGKYKLANLECGDCPAGTYSTTFGSTSCTACPSGMSSPIGSTSSSQCDICLSAAAPLKVIRPPFIDSNSSSFSSRTLTLTVKVAAGYDSPSIRFVGSNSTCESYGSWVGSSSFDSQCYKRFSRATSWSIAHPNCGLKRSEMTGELWFTGYLLVKGNQQVKLSDGSTYQRQLQNLLGYAVRFPTSITITTQSTFVNPGKSEYNPSMVNASVQSAGIYSWIASSSPLGGELVIVTHMPYPYYLQAGPTLIGPNDLTSSVESAPLASSDCSDSVELKQQCVQYWKIKIAPLSQDDTTRCDFSGNYTLLFMPSCHEIALGDKFICTLNQTGVTAQLTTSKYCPYLTPLAVGLTGSLETYSDSDLSISATKFNLNENIYFKLEVEGAGEILSVNIDNVALHLGDPLSLDITLVSGGVAVSSGSLSNANVSVKNSDQSGERNVATLDFALLRDFIPLQANSSTIATINIIAGVKFSNTDGTSSRRLLSIERSIMPASLKDEEQPSLRQSSSQKWKRSFAKLTQLRHSINQAQPLQSQSSMIDSFDAIAIPTLQSLLSVSSSDSTNQLLLQTGSEDPAVQADAAFIIGPAHLA